MRFPSRLPLALLFSLFLSASHLPLAKPQSDLPPGSAGWIIRHSYPVRGFLRLA